MKYYLFSPNNYVKAAVLYSESHTLPMIMKKIFLLALLAIYTMKVASQTITLTMIASPCNSNGVVVATFTGITPPFYDYWITGGIGEYHTVTGVTDTLVGFTGGGISVKAMTIAPYPFDSIFVPLPFVVNVTNSPAVCPGLPMLSASATGGTPPYTYKWLKAPALTLVSIANPVTVPAGNYYLRVTDAAGCVGGFSSPISAVSAVTFSVSATSTAAVCPTMSTSTMTISGSSTPPYTYLWQNIYTGVIAGTTNPALLNTGVYLAKTSDATGCSATTYDFVTVTSDFTATVTTTDANCTNGTASTAITGGIGPFTYLWSNGATTPTISGLVTGTYTVGITDGAGCVSDTILSGYVNQLIAISVGDVVTPATCIDSNGSITAFGSGGVTPYSYLWSNGGTTATIGSLSSSYYDVTVTDANGCLGWGGDYVSTSTPITVTYATTPSACLAATGTCTLTITGGTAPYSVQFFSSPMQTTATPTGLAAGNYYFEITDALGCTRSGIVTIPPVDMIYLSFTDAAATCAASDGSVAVSAYYGGVAPFTYLWSTGATTATLPGIPSGWYHVTVTDAHGCSAVASKYVPYNSPLVLGLTNTPASCLYVSDGTITAVASFGTPPYAYSMGGSSSGTVTIPGLPTDPYWISVTDAHGCTAEDYTYVGYNVYDSSCFCVVKGTVYDDANHNCVQDAGEVGIQHVQMSCTSIGYTYTDTSGDYYFLVPTGSYTVSQTVLGMYPLSPCQPNHIPISSVAATGCYTVVNFADTLNPIHDMHISTWDYTGPRPGFPYQHVTVITNDGTVMEPNILASYVPDGQIFGATFVPAGIFTGAPYYYSTGSSAFALAPGDGQEFLVNYNVPADIPLGTSVVFTDTVAYAAPMSNWLADYSPWNNVNYFTTTTVGSYDPNFKEVSPKGWGPAGVITVSDSVLEYMVHFQNTGTYMAENVVVKDTLDPSLDWTTLRPVYMSNKCVVDIDEHGVATFTFKNIDLPPSSTEPVASNAMFTYTVKQRPALPMGTHILNSASIYFDFNAPIKTKSTYNTIAWSAGVPTTPTATGGGNAFTIYPNPANNTFNAIINSSAGGGYSMRVTDVAGKTELNKTLSLIKGSQTVTVDVSRLSAGVYFVTLIGNDGNAETQKLVIMK